MTDAPSLTDFLLQRIAEDEAAARAATPGPWSAGSEYADAAVWQGDDHSMGIAHASWEYDESSAANFDHIARHDPARVLARCEADRRIVGMHAPDKSHPDPWAHTVDPACTSYGDFDHTIVYEDECPTLRALASVYAGHPDYREEWRA
jgi:hypothetical protein